jgi:hypothetical protein
LLDTIQKVFFRHRLSPRKYNGHILYRITEPKTKDRCREIAAKIRKMGVYVRIEPFGKGYAVWISESKVRVRVPRGYLGTSDAATKYLTSLLPIGYYAIKGYKDYTIGEGYFVGITIATPQFKKNGAPVSVLLRLRENSKYVEVYSIQATHMGYGHGTIVVNVLKRYVDSKKKGLMFRCVRNDKFFNKFSWLKEFDRDYEEADFPDYVYKVKKGTKIRYIWT